MAATIPEQDLEKRIAALESGRQYQADRMAVQTVEQEHLVQLRTIRNSMTATAATTSGGGGVATSSREMVALRDENERLRNTIAKLRYRVEHLVDGMDEMMMIQQQGQGTTTTKPAASA
jgi:cell division protein FtsB